MQTERPTEILAGRYSLDEELRRDGAGITWRAVDTLLQRTVRVTVLRPSLADDPAFLERLAAETAAGTRVTGGGSARLLDSGADRGITFRVEEDPGGESVRTLLDRAGSLSHGSAVRITLAVLEALGAVHRAGALHLDLQPDTVLVGNDGRIRITGPGIGAAVRATRPPAEAAELLAPTPDPPELHAGGAPDARTDVYLAGALLSELLTGDRPGSSPPPGGPRNDVPRPLATALARAVAPHPDGRFADVDRFADALRSASPDTAAGLPDAIAREGRGWMRTWFVVPGLVVLAAAIVIGIGLRLGRLELGGPLGVRAKPVAPSTSAPASSILTIASVRSFDPYGDGSENEASAPLAADGDPASVWRSENYFDATLNNKPGFGLIFDLGSEHTVTGFRLQTPHPGFAFGVGVGDDPAQLAAAAAAAGSFTAEPNLRARLGPAIGRYVLLWIGSVVDAGDGRRAEVSEFQVVGT